MTNVIKMRRSDGAKARAGGVKAQKPITSSVPRAFPFFGSLSNNLKTFLVTEDASDPHLCVGEYAVIDTEDRKPVHGELFLWQSSFAERRRRIVHVTSSYMNITGPGANDTLVYWMSDLRGFRCISDGEVPLFTGLSDGPYQAHNLKKYLIGRVVGVSQSALGELIEPEAGWEDEEAGNASFDAVEYLDTLMAGGYEPYVINEENGRQSYFESFPKKSQGDASEKAVMAVRWKYCRASEAKMRVVAECERRGLVHERQHPPLRRQTG